MLILLGDGVGGVFPCSVVVVVDMLVRVYSKLLAEKMCTLYAIQLKEATADASTTLTAASFLGGHVYVYIERERESNIYMLSPVNNAVLWINWVNMVIHS